MFNFGQEKMPMPGGKEKIKYQLQTFEKGELGEDGLRVMEALPEKVVSEMPVIIAPGWGNTALGMRKSLETFGEEGRRALTFDHRREKTLSSISEDPNESTETLQRAFEILAALKQQGIEEPVNGVGYSEGGIDLLVAARIAPEKFKNIALVAPGGMLGEDNSIKLASRFTHGAMKDGLSTLIKPETIVPALRYVKELAKYVGKNPAMAYREVGSIVQANITEIVKELTKKGIGIVFICGEDDKAFPMYKENRDGTMKDKTVQRQAGEIYKEQKAEGGETFAGFYSVKGGHGELVLHPEKYTKVVEEALCALEKRMRQQEENNARQVDRPEDHP